MKEILALLLLFSIPVYADVSGSINFTYVNATTGLYGYTVNLCNTTANCYGMTCFTDYDGTGTAGSAGWCNISSTSCYHDNSAYATGTNICYTNTTYFTCSSGNWSSLNTCSSGQTCASVGSAGNCAAPSSSSSSSSSSNLSLTAAQRASSMIFTSYPISFDMVQGTSVMKYTIVKNNGNVTAYNVTVTLNGLSWYTVSPNKVDRITINNETMFTLNISAPSNAELKTYAVRLVAASTNTSVSSSFNVIVKPSNTTIQERIFPDYANYVALLSSIETSMKSLENSSADVQELQTLLLDAKNKLLQANRSIESKDYYSASQYLDDAKSILDQASIRLNATATTGQAQPSGIDSIFIAIIIVAAAVIIVIIYMLLPTKEPGYDKRWVAPKTEKKDLWSKLRGKKKEK